MKRLSLLFVITASPCVAQGIDQKLSATPDARLDQRILDQIVAPIASQAALEGYLRNLPSNSPLLALPEDARQEFLDSLVFGTKGLGSYRYVPLQKIDMADAYRILSLFGVQQSLAVAPEMKATSQDGAVVKAMLSPSPVVADYEDYACVSKATCRKDTGAICIGAGC